MADDAAEQQTSGFLPVPVAMVKEIEFYPDGRLRRIVLHDPVRPERERKQRGRVTADGGADASTGHG